MAQAAKSAKETKPAKEAKATKATKAIKPSKPSKPSGKPSIFARLGRYFGDVRAEMRRVVWPSRSEIVNSSGIVMVTLVIFIIMISIYDQVSVFLVGVLGKIGG
jgi:preprotein translocase subunit SecE